MNTLLIRLGKNVGPKNGLKTNIGEITPIYPKQCINPAKNTCLYEFQHSPIYTSFISHPLSGFLGNMNTVALNGKTDRANIVGRITFSSSNFLMYFSSIFLKYPFFGFSIPYREEEIVDEPNTNHHPVYHILKFEFQCFHFHQ